jgi:sugar lactone lactonase YvrE
VEDWEIRDTMISVGKPICIAPTGDRCGEGVVWHDTEEAVYWTDINRFLIHRYSVAERSVKTWLFDEPATALIRTDREDTFAVLLGSRVIFWEPATDARRDQGFHLKGWPSVRLNDGRADPRGSLWVGSMQNNVGADGSAGEAGGTDGLLYRIDPDGAVTEWQRDIGIANTLAWSPDRKHFYFADTLANKLNVYDYDSSTGSIANERPFLVDFSRGAPDGSTMDSEGYLWNCRHGGGCIVRVAPNGEIDRVIEMPTSNITTCTFGGADLTTLFITTAASGAPAGERLAGSLFMLETGIAGQPENRFRYFESRKN